MFKRHYAVLIISLFVGLAAVAPHLYFIISPQNDYRGINILKSSDEDAYMSYVQAVADGRSNYFFPYLFEYKDAENSMVSLPEIILGKIIGFTGISAVNLFLLLKFFGPFIIFILLYWLTYLIAKNKAAAILAPSLIITGLGLIGATPGVIWSTIMWHGPNYEFWDYIRLLNPAMSGIFFSLALISIAYLFLQPTVKRALIAGVMFGILFYVYLYFWTFALVSLGVILIYNLVTKAFKQSFYIFGAILLGILIGLPQIYKLFNLLNVLISGSSDLVNVNMASRPGPIFEKVVLGTFVLYVLFMIYLRKRGTLNKVFLVPLFLLITSIIVVNQQLITGKVIQPHHYYFFTNLPSAYIALAIIFGYFVNLIKQKYLKYSIVTAVFLLVFAWGVGVQASSYKYWAPIYRGYQKYGDILGWLKSNAPKDSVIYSNDQFADIVSAYTPFFVYWNGHAGDSAYPPMERKELVYFLRMRLNNIGAEKAEKYLRDRREEIGWGFYGQYYRDTCGTYGCFPNKMMDELIAGYKDFLKQPFEKEFRRYKVDYFVWDEKKNPEWRVGEFKFLEPIYNYSDVTVFKVK